MDTPMGNDTSMPKGDDMEGEETTTPVSEGNDEATGMPKTGTEDEDTSDEEGEEGGDGTI